MMYISKVKSGGGFHAMWIPAITVIVFIMFTSLLSAKAGGWYVSSNVLPFTDEEVAA